jgi:hypothetical protein
MVAVFMIGPRAAPTVGQRTGSGDKPGHAERRLGVRSRIHPRLDTL